MVTAAAAAENESTVVVGYHRDYAGFLAAKLSGDGTLLWEWEVSKNGVTLFGETNANSPYEVDE